MLSTTFSIRIPKPMKQSLRDEYNNVNKGVNTALSLLFMQKREIYSKIKALNLPQLRQEAKANGLNMASEASEFCACFDEYETLLNSLNKFEFFLFKDLLFNAK